MQLTSILLDNFASDYSIKDNENIPKQDNALANLSKINIFIGVNNSGKSRLMRTIFANSEFLYTRSGVDTEKLSKAIERYNKDLSNAARKEHSHIDIDFPELNQKGDYLQNNKKKFDLEKWFIINPINKSLTINGLNTQRNHAQDFQLHRDNITGFDTSKDNITKLTNELNELNSIFHKTYIPILRGLRPIHIKDKDKTTFEKENNYFHRTVFDYFENEKDAFGTGLDFTPEVENKLNSNVKEKVIKPAISTGLDFYEQLSHLKLGDPHERQLVLDFEIFLGKTFFQNELIVITPHKRKDVVTFKIGDGDERPIYDIGDGIQAIILLTYPLFFNKGKDMIFFFEEPEIYLHPSFQRIFIDTLLNDEFESFQYFFTTHSNHFLDITLDHENISIYNFRKEKGSTNKFEIENVQSGNNSLLEELGVRNASVFLSNCTIWVEGISDRIYISQYLKVLMKDKAEKAKEEAKRAKEKESDKSIKLVDFKEDYHYSFVEYSGSNIAHWSFGKKSNEDVEIADSKNDKINTHAVCNRIFLVVDQDGAGEVDKKGKEIKKTKKKRQEELREQLGNENFHCLDCREIENALSPDIIKKVIEGRKKKGKASMKINFIKDWSYKAYQMKKLGDFIIDSIEVRDENNKIEETKKILNQINDKGTIHDKIGFAKAAVKEIKLFEDLSKPAKELTEAIYKFIEDNNK
jgi:predicted ATP-dependent endonuclease of OLD family